MEQLCAIILHQVLLLICVENKRGDQSPVWSISHNCNLVWTGWWRLIAPAIEGKADWVTAAPNLIVPRIHANERVIAGGDMGACEDRQVRSSRDVASLETNTVQSHQGKKSTQRDDRGICRSAMGGLSPGTFFTKKKKKFTCVIRSASSDSICHSVK